MEFLILAGVDLRVGDWSGGGQSAGLHNPFRVSRERCEVGFAGDACGDIHTHSRYNANSFALLNKEGVVMQVLTGESSKTAHRILMVMISRQLTARLAVDTG